jgi:heat shock protein HslJ
VPVTGETIVASTLPVPTELPPEAVLAAQQWLADQLSVAAEQVQIADLEQTEWSDSCLGLGGPNESCAQVITPGWRVVLEINGQSYEVRTDENASAIRLATPLGTPGAVTGIENTAWNLIAFGEPGAEPPVVDGAMITLLLAAGQAGGFGGCNSYGGTYQLDGNNISFGEITSTLVACANDDLTEQEQSFFTALQSVRTYELEDNQLRLLDESGEVLLSFEAALTVPGNLVPTVETPSG